MGLVTVVSDSATPAGPPLAMKRLRSDLAEDDAVVAMFLDEARIAAAIDHPNVVRTLDVGRDDDGPFLVMEFVDGFTLADWIADHHAAGKQMPLGLCVEVARQVAAGLAAAHALTDQRGEPLALVHRDVSPQNILVDYDGQVRVADFGIARAVGRTTRTSTGVLKGKVGYMSPEQLRFEPLDARADLFALGVVIYEMATCQRLYAAPENEEALRATLEQPAPDLGETRPEAPDALVELLFRLLAKKPEHRPASAAALRDELDALADALAANTDGRTAIAEYATMYLAELRRGPWPQRDPQCEVPTTRDNGQTSTDASTRGSSPTRLIAIGAGITLATVGLAFTLTKGAPVPDASSGRVTFDAFEAQWRTPNTITWAFSPKGRAEDFLRYELALSDNRALVEAFDPQVVLGPSQVPDLGYFERPYTHRSDRVESAMTIGLSPGTVYYAQMRVFDVAGEYASSEIVAAKTPPRPSRSVPIFSDAHPSAFASVRPPCFSMQSTDAPGHAAHYQYAVSCAADGAGTCGPSADVDRCWENLAFAELTLQLGKLVPSVLNNGFVEVAVALDDAEPAYYSELWLHTPAGRFQASPLSLRADGEFHVYQVPLRAFGAKGQPLTLQDLPEISEFMLGANFTRGATIRVGEVLLRL